MGKLRIYVDQDNVLANFEKAFKEKRVANAKEYPQAEIGFFLNLEPMKGAIEGFKALSKFHDVWILTSPSVKNPLCYTEKRLWVEKHLGFDTCKKLIISPDKSLLKGDILIDDRIVNGVEDFEGTHIHFGQNGVNWDSIVSDLCKLFYLI